MRRGHRRNRRLLSRDRSFWATPAIEVLESRLCLAGNVTAILAGDSLQLFGDRDANSVAVTLNGGDLVVEGLDGTTINGSVDVFIVAAGSDALAGNLFAKLGIGDDVLLINGADIGGDVNIKGGRGADQIGVSGTVIGGTLEIEGKGGADSISISATDVTGKVTVRGGAGGDLVSIDNLTTSELLVRTGRGSDSVVIDAIDVTGRVRIFTGNGDDDVVLTNSRISGNLRIGMQRGQDVMQLDGNDVNGRVRLRGGAGRDSIIGTNNDFALLVVHGGRGMDVVEFDATNTIGDRFRIRSADDDVVDSDLIASRLTDSAIERAAALQGFFDALLTNTPPTTSGLDNVTVVTNASPSLINLAQSFTDEEDGSELNYAVQSNSNSALFDSVTIDNTTNVLTLDYATNATGTATIVVQATDSGAFSTTSSFTVTVQDSSTANTFAVAENSAAGTSVGTVVPSSTAAGTTFGLSPLPASQELRLASDDHLSGDPAAKILLIEYLDFQCPICRAYHPIIQQLKQDFDGDLAVVQRHLPLTSIHPNAQAAAIAAEAAGVQGQFDAFGNLLFDRQDEWSGVANPQSLFESYAQELGLNLTQFRAAQADSATIARVTRDTDAAAALGATATPTFFLQGSRITNPAATLEAFGTVISSADSAFTNAFVVNRLTGQILVADPAQLDFETDPSLPVNVVASLANGGTEAIVATVNLTDVAET